MKQLTKEQIILETLDYYSEDPNGRRGMMENACTYLSEDGKMCAFGRVLRKNIREKYKCNTSFIVSGLVNAEGGNLDKLLQKQYQGHGIEFWHDIQGFHDVKNNWSKIRNELTEYGEEQVLRLLEKYAN